MRILSYQFLLVLGTAFLFQNAAAADRDLEQYMARSLVLRNIEAFNDMLHINASRSEHDIIKYKQQEADLFADGCTIELNIFDSPGLSKRYASLAARDLILEFEDDLKLATLLHEPMMFHALEFSDLAGTAPNQTIQLTGQLDFVGTFVIDEEDVEETPDGYPFTAEFIVGLNKGALTCKMSSFKAGRGQSKPKTISTFYPWSIHSEEFLDPERSALCEPTTGLCAPEELNEVVRPILKWKIAKEWMNEKMKDPTWDILTAIRRSKDASRSAAELFLSLPYYLPGGSFAATNPHIYREQDVEIRDLLDLLRVDPKEVKNRATATLNAHSDWDPVSIQANLVRAWYYITHESENAERITTSLKPAAFYPTIKEVSLIGFFGHAQTGAYSDAMAQMDQFNGLCDNSVMAYHLDRTFAGPWFQYAGEMDRNNSHAEALKGYFIGAQLYPDKQRLETLAYKARKMGHADIAKACYERILQFKDLQVPAETWWDLAMVRSELGLDPAKEITQAMKMNEQETALANCARARYLNNTGKKAEAENELLGASKKFRNNRDLLMVQGELSTQPEKRKKYWLKAVASGEKDKGTRYFKEGFVNQWIAERTETGLSASKKRDLYKESGQRYKLAVSNGYSKSLTYRKIGETYIMLNDLEEASRYYQGAIKNNNQEVTVFFTQAILDLINNNMTSFKANLNKAQNEGFISIATDRDRELFDFLWILADAHDAAEVMSANSEMNKSAKDQVLLSFEKIEKRLDELDHGMERGKTYAAFGWMILESMKGYYEREPGDKKKFKERTFSDMGLLENMKKYSDIELHFFRGNSLIETLRKWNDKFENNVYKNLPKRVKNDKCSYLMESKLFKDTYNYL